MAGIPLVGALPALPSPLAGVPATPDLFSSLMQAGPNFAQGLSAGEDLRYKTQQRKMELAQQRLQTYAPIALQNPKNPAAMQAVQQSFKDLGLDPGLAIKDGSIDTDALMQYSPMFKLITSPGFAFLPPDVQTGIWQQAFPGTKVPGFVGKANINPKDANALLSTIRSAASTGDLKMVGSTAQALAKIPGYEALGQQLAAEAATGKLSPKVQAYLAGQGSLIGLRGTEQQYIQGPKTAVATSTAAVNNARIPEIQSQTKKNVADLSLIQSEVSKNYATAHAALENADTSRQRLGVELERLSVTSLGHAITAANDYNSKIADLQRTRSSLASTVQRYVTSGQAYLPNQRDAQGNPIPQPDFAKAQAMLQQIDKQLSTSKPIDLSKITQAALQRSGLPNTMKFIETPKDNAPPFKVPAGYTAGKDAQGWYIVDKAGHKYRPQSP